MKKIIITLSIAILSAMIMNCSSDQVTVEQYQQEVKNQEMAKDTVQQEPVTEPVKDTVVKEEPKVVLSLAGKYNVEGKSAAGNMYNGTVTMAKKGDAYQLTMKLKARTITGNGTLDGSKFTVFWGKNRKFEYEVKDDGRIMSTWNKGEENFIPLEK